MLAISTVPSGRKQRRRNSMANQEQFDILTQGVETWNQWRGEYAHIQPDLRKANLRGADLSGADLSMADLGYADLTGANLSNTNFRTPFHVRRDAEIEAYEVAMKGYEGLSF